MKYIKIQNNSASAVIALQGAHIFNYTRASEENSLLWLSEENTFEKGVAIRGGVPICWPWFGINEDISLPQHGFARTSLFEHIYTKEIDEDTTEVLLKLTYSKESFEMWRYKFNLEVKITVSKELAIELTTTNIDTKPFKITQALHTYFSVSDISDVRIIGLDSKVYFDALIQKKGIQEGDILFEGEFDKVYQSVDAELVLMDANRAVDIKNEGCASVVVWNPWIEKSKRMSNLGDEEYKEFVCIESANAMEDYKIIHPFKTHTLRATII